MILRLFILCVHILGPAESALPFEGRIAVIDGDTLDVGGHRVRLFGIDAPEIEQLCTVGGKPWECGRWARAETTRRYQNRVARCQFISRDSYGRIVARCGVNGADIGENLVRDGLAQAYRHYGLDYVDEEKAAAIHALGIWRGEIQTPADFRADLRGAAQTSVSSCDIKGNISKRGRIYHLPGQEHYAVTRITARFGERWFCSEAAAVSAGWRKSKR